MTALATACESVVTPEAKALDPLPMTGVNPTGTFAGPADDDETFVTVRAGEEHLVVYACDGETRSEWFLVSGRGLPAIVRNGSGASLEVSESETGLAGLIVAADESWSVTFDIPLDTGAVLTRGTSGVDGRRVVGGWIRLGDGSQRGAITVTDKNGTTTTGSTLDENALPPPETKELPGTFTFSRTDPVAEALATFNSPFDFNVVGFGDSYGAGEGAPDVAGGRCLYLEGTETLWFDDLESVCLSDDGCSSGYCEASGPLPECKPPPACIMPPVSWHPSDPAAAYCHRTPNSGLERGVARLRETYSEVDVRFKSFACTGAIAANLTSVAQTDEPENPGNKNWPIAEGAALQLPPQLDQLDAFLQTSVAACSIDVESKQCWATGVDAMVASIGGNDAKFATVLNAALGLTDLLAPGVDNETLEASRVGIASLEEKYLAIRDRIASAPTVDGRNLMPDPGRFYLLGYPDLFSTGPNATDLCTGEQLSGNALGDNVLQLLSTLEVKDMSALQPLLREAQAESATQLGWTFLSDIHPRSLGHGACMAPDVRYFNTNLDAVAQQGSDMAGGSGVIYLSMGIMHPNALGYEQMYAEPIFEALEDALTAKFRPAAPSGFRVVAYRIVDGVTLADLAWNDNSSTELVFELTPSTGSVVRTAPDTTQATIQIGAGASTVSLRACSVHSLCSLIAMTLPLLPAVPTLPPTQLSLAAPTTIGRRLSWVLSASPAESITQQEITVRSSTKAVVKTVRVDRSISSVFLSSFLFGTLPTSGSITVRACNTLGCSPESTPVSLGK